MTLSRFQKLRRLMLALGLAASLAPLLFIRPVWDEANHFTIEMAGAALIAIGILGRLWCTLYIGGRKAREIVDVGPYSMSRNPLYVFSAIAAAGMGAQTGSLLMALAFALLTWLAFSVVIRREEQHLAALFGAPYLAYCARVPRFLPDPRLFRDDNTLTVTPHRLYRTLGDGLFFFAAIPAFETIEHLQQSGVIDAALYVY
ncbi:methyltransferase family protein [Aureimonas sp. AU40]|uniref:methyltransferase family protein n=1 Tax=Aureimonas sp. AU40 TaxID=1637747 RepID=UPI0007846B36|nr:isoprenylcysteine carboxylmethyltransferase family protein [Aureimonas sp. AU40]